MVIQTYEVMKMDESREQAMLALAKKQWDIRQKIAETKLLMRDMAAAKREEVRRLQDELKELDQEWSANAVQLRLPGV